MRDADEEVDDVGECERVAEEVGVTDLESVGEPDNDLARDKDFEGDSERVPDGLALGVRVPVEVGTPVPEMV